MRDLFKLPSDLQSVRETETVGFRTELEVMDNRESFEVSFLLEPVISLLPDELQSRLDMSQEGRRGEPGLKEAKRRMAGGHRASKSGFYTSQKIYPGPTKHRPRWAACRRHNPIFERLKVEREYSGCFGTYFSRLPCGLGLPRPHALCPWSLRVSYLSLRHSSFVPEIQDRSANV